MRAGAALQGIFANMRALSWFLGLMAVALAAIAAFSWPAWLLLHPHFDFPFHRIGERVGMLALLLGFVAWRGGSNSPTVPASATVCRGASSCARWRSVSSSGS